MAIIIFVAATINYYLYKNLSKNKKILSFLILLFGILISNPRTNFGTVSGIGKIVEAKGNRYVVSYGNSFLRRNPKFSIKSDEKYYVGDVINFKGVLRRGNPPYNENGFYEEKYLKARGVGGVLDGKITWVKKRGIGSKFARRLEYSAEFLKPEVKGTYIGILSSNGSMSDDYNAYRNLGISHIFAFSGLHVGLVFLFIKRILKPFGKNVGDIISLITLFLYIYILGFPVSAVRAFIMVLCLVFSRFLKFKYRSIEIILVSMVFQFAYNPYVIYSVGFWLSYAATLGIIIFARRFKFLGTTFIGKGLAVSLGAFIMTLPIILRCFYMFNPITIIANLVVIPMYSLGVGFSFAHLLVPNILTKTLIDFLFGMGANIGRFLNYYFKSIVTGKVNWYFIFSYYLSVLLALKYREFNFSKESLKAMGLCIITLFVLNFQDVYEREDFRADFMYVGQGDCSIIKHDGKYYMVDTGGSGAYDPTRSYVLPYLLSKNITKIEGLFISHYDTDHCEGLFELLPEIKFKTIYANTFEEDNIYAETIRDNFNLRRFKNMDLGDLKIREVSHKMGEGNDGSLALLVNYKDLKVFYTGDLSKEALDSISLEKVDILKVPHHGSKYSVSKKLFGEIRPDFSVISYGPNYYGMPSSDIIKELRRYGEVLETKKHGQATFIYNKNLEKYTVRR